MWCACGVSRCNSRTGLTILEKWQSDVLCSELRNFLLSFWVQTFVTPCSRSHSVLRSFSFTLTQMSKILHIIILSFQHK
jgi:hypothetical protein